MEPEPPVPHLTGEPITEPEEAPLPATASFWRRWHYFLFSVPHESRTNSAIIRWWEKRRLVYNVIVGAFGIVTVVIFGCGFRNNVPWKGILAADDNSSG